MNKPFLFLFILSTATLATAATVDLERLPSVKKSHHVLIGIDSNSPGISQTTVCNCAVYNAADCIRNAYTVLRTHDFNNGKHGVELVDVAGDGHFTARRSSTPLVPVGTKYRLEEIADKGPTKREGYEDLYPQPYRRRDDGKLALSHKLVPILSKKD